MSATVDRRETPAASSAANPTPDAGVIEEARAHGRRRRRAVAATLLSTIAIGGIVLGAGGAGGGSHARGVAASAGVSAGRSPRHSTASCPPAQSLQGRPSRSLLAILGVLRRPAVAADAIHIFQGGFTRGVFVRYIRRARVADGARYYLYPVIVGECGTREKPHQGIMELAQNVDLGHGLIGGSGGGGESAGAIEQGRDAGSGPPGSGTSATVTMVVPDGVATVTLRYPAGRASGYSPKISPAVTLTAKPVENLLVVRVPRSDPLGRATMVWRGPRGRVIKTLHGV
ncbi:MAG TPA: hypothetical protein VGN13_13135 [Solirubrobacteraceae bacterium]|jgi:hypothetical protein